MCSGHAAVAERRRLKQAPCQPTDARTGGFQPELPEMPLLKKTAAVLPLYQTYLPRKPPPPKLRLPPGCTVLSFLQCAAANVFILDKLSDVDAYPSCAHLATCSQSFRTHQCAHKLFL